MYGYGTDDRTSQGRPHFLKLIFIPGIGDSNSPWLSEGSENYSIVEDSVFCCIFVAIIKIYHY